MILHTAAWTTFSKPDPAALLLIILQTCHSHKIKARSVTWLINALSTRPLLSLPFLLYLLSPRASSTLAIFPQWCPPKPQSLKGGLFWPLTLLLGSWPWDFNSTISFPRKVFKYSQSFKISQYSNSPFSRPSENALNHGLYQTSRKLCFFSYTYTPTIMLHL